MSAVVALATALVILAALATPVTGRGAAERPAGPSSVAVATVDPAVGRALAAGGSASVIVRAPGDAREAARAAVTATGGDIVMDLAIIDGFSARITPDGLERLSQVPGVTVRLDSEVQPQLLEGQLGGDGDSDSGGSTTTTAVTPADSSYVETIRAHKLHKQGFKGQGIGIAIVDTGVSEVGDLEGRLVGALDLAADGDHADHYGHGTFIAGVAAGNGVASKGEHAGVAPEANVIPVKITGLDGSSDVTHMLAGIQYVVSMKDTYDIEVMNLSLGTNSSQSWKVDLLNYAVQRAWDAGIVVVVSAANLGPTSQTIAKPGDDPLVITVGAVDAHATSDRSDDTMAEFSSRGPTKTDGLEKPDLVAPGVSVVGLRAPQSYVDENYPGGRVDDAYFRASGTSFATGAVTGAVALLRQAHPDWTPDQVKGALLSTAAKGPVGDRNVDGYGSIDVAAASALSTPPVANQGVGRSTGAGPLDLSRGTVEVRIEVPTLLGLVTTVVNVLLDGDLTAQDLTFDAAEYTGTTWSAAKWYESDWYAAKWYAAKWYDADWYAAKWYAAKWY